MRYRDKDLKAWERILTATWGNISHYVYYDLNDGLRSVIKSPEFERYYPKVMPRQLKKWYNN